MSAIRCAHGRPSIRSCPACRKRATMEANKRWRNRWTEADYQRVLELHRIAWAKRSAKRKLRCNACGAKREPHHLYCAECKRAFTQSKDNRYYNTHKKQIAATHHARWIARGGRTPEEKARRRVREGRQSWRDRRKLQRKAA